MSDVVVAMSAVLAISFREDSAAAEQHGLPLLCVGDDSPATDLTVLQPGTG